MTGAGCAYVGATSGTIQLSPELSAQLGTPAAPGSEALTPVTVSRLNSDEVLSMVMHYEYSKAGVVWFTQPSLRNLMEPSFVSLVSHRLRSVKKHVCLRESSRLTSSVG